VRVNKEDKIGEVGKKGLFHFEIRPLNDKEMDTSAAWSKLYAGDPSMVWSKYQPVDPSTFDFDEYCGKSGGAK
jgi:murein DD-endopeptidase MepM/ murein hydrolase activator NlpD